MIATRRFLTKFRSVERLQLRHRPSQPTGDPDLYLKIPAGPSYDGFASCFANFVPGPEAAVLGAVQRPLALGAFTTPCGPAAWTTIPSWAVIGRDDRAIPPAELTTMAQRAAPRSPTPSRAPVDDHQASGCRSCDRAGRTRQLAFPPPDPRRSTHRTKGDRTTCR